DQSRNAVLPHRFQHVLRQVGAFPEVNVRLAHGAGDVRVGGQVKNRVGAGHGFSKPAKVFDVTADYVKPFFIHLGGLEMPRSPGAEVVVNRDLGVAPSKQASDQMAADEARPARHEETAHRISPKNVVRIKYNIGLV